MKLTTKLLLAFLLISIISSGIIVLFTRVATNREFEKFISDRYKTELVEEMALKMHSNNLGANQTTMIMIVRYIFPSPNQVEKLL